MLSRLLLVPALLAALTGCAGDTRSRATAAQQEACRKRADEVYNRQNPADVYRSDQYISSQRDSPFSSSMSDPTAALSSRYARANLIDTCLRNAAAKPEATPAPAPAAAP